MVDGESHAAHVSWIVDRLERPYSFEDAVSALLGIERKLIRQLVGARLAAGPEAVRLLRQLPELVRQAPNTVDARAVECAGEVRGPIMWPETICARSASGADDVFVCRDASRSFDVPENRLLVEALDIIAHHGRLATELEHAPYDDEDLQAARQNGQVARRYSSTKPLAGVKASRTPARERPRLRRTRVRKQVRLADAVVRRAKNPLHERDIVALSDRRTALLHYILIRAAIGYHGHDAVFDLDDGAITTAHVRFAHPALHRDPGVRTPHGIVVVDRVRRSPRNAVRLALRDNVPVASVGHVDEVDLALTALTSA